MSKAFKWPKLPNSRPYLDKGYTSIQMREYALKCIGEAIRNKQWVDLTEDDIKDIFFGQTMIYNTDGVLFGQAIQAKLREKNCGQ